MQVCEEVGHLGQGVLMFILLCHYEQATVRATVTMAIDGNRKKAQALGVDSLCLFPGG